MSDFITFARECGVILDALPELGRWVRLPTVDHPRKRNGAVKFMGDHGFCQNHATMTAVSVWKVGKDRASKIDHKAIAEQIAASERKRHEAQRRAAARASEIVKASRLAQHEYLKAKGFPDERGLVWASDDGAVLVVPMRIGADLVGCQLIREDGDKKFLFGQATSDAAFVIGRGKPVYCEGYATALSVRDALSSARMSGSVVACFSAGNLARMAVRMGAGFVIADNDASRTGERAAINTGMPYWLSDRIGEDFNDYAQRVGRFKASQSLKLSMMGSRRPQTAREAVP